MFRSASVLRRWPLLLILLVSVALAGCADEGADDTTVGEEGAAGEGVGEEEAVEENDAPGFGVVALVGAVAAALGIAAFRRRA